MEHTKGKMIIYKEKYFEYIRSDGAQIRVAEITMPYRTDSIKDANDVLKRWNAFEKDGEVVKLLAACEMLKDTVKAIATELPMDLEEERWGYKQATQAIAEAGEAVK